MHGREVKKRFKKRFKKRMIKMENYKRAGVK
jgi:hypothetical protein